jgi:hypothetical protein
LPRSSVVFLDGLALAMSLAFPAAARTQLLIVLLFGDKAW